MFLNIITRADPGFLDSILNQPEPRRVQTTTFLILGLRKQLEEIQKCLLFKEITEFLPHT